MTLFALASLYCHSRDTGILSDIEFIWIISLQWLQNEMVLLQVKSTVL